jgi:DNA polymerase
MRTALKYELDAIDLVKAGGSHADLAALGDDPTPVARKLSMLIRPAIVARPGRVLIWSDLAQIEARVLPWLAKSNLAGARLEYFRQVDADPSLPDLYTVSAAEMFHVTTEEVEADKKLPPEASQGFRQRGKIAELALGFGGGFNALQKMAANYGIRFDDDLAKDIVGRWREANTWAPIFWGKHGGHDSHGLWGAFNTALEQPGVTCNAGRVSYVCMPYLGRKAVFCVLPSGRALCYRNVRLERTEILDAEGKVTGIETNLVFDRGFGSQKIWHGILCENVTQACAADILRGTIARLEDDQGLEWMPAIGHTHDELIVEPVEAHGDRARATLRQIMQRGFDWSQGLPLSSDESAAYHYSKSESGDIIW